MRATSALVSPFGDLWLIHRHVKCKLFALWHVPGVVHTTPLASLKESRDAHSWDTLPGDVKDAVIPSLVLKGNLGGIAVAKDWTKLYVTAKQQRSVVLLEIPMQAEDDEDSTDDNITEDSSPTPKIVFNLTEHVVWADEEPGLIATTQQDVMFWSTPQGVVVIDLQKKLVLTLIPVSQPITSLTMGDDAYLYISTETTLMRIQTRTKPVHQPTNLVLKTKTAT